MKTTPDNMLEIKAQEVYMIVEFSMFVLMIAIAITTKSTLIRIATIILGIIFCFLGMAAYNMKRELLIQKFINETNKIKVKK